MLKMKLFFCKLYSESLFRPHLYLSVVSVLITLASIQARANPRLIVDSVRFNNGTWKSPSTTDLGTIEPGQSFWFDVRVKNIGTSGVGVGDGVIWAVGYTDVADTRHSGFNVITNYPAGFQKYDINGNLMPTQNASVDATASSWSSQQTRSMGVRVQAPASGSVTFWVRATFADADSYEILTTDPSQHTGTHDNQGYFVYRYTVNVYSPPTCSVNKPNRPTGPTTGVPNQPYTYTTGGSSCSCGSGVQYRFWWQDHTGGNLGQWSASSSEEISWSEPGTYEIDVQARCSSNTSVISSYSDYLTVTISQQTGSISADIKGSSGGIRVDPSNINAVLLQNTDYTEKARRANPSSNPVHFSNIPYGRYYFDLYCWDMYAGSSGSFDLNSPSQTVTFNSFNRRPLAFTVRHSDGSTPLAGATVFLDSWNREHGSWTLRATDTTGSNGVRTFHAWPTTNSGERYRVRVENPVGQEVHRNENITLADTSGGSSYNLVTTAVSTSDVTVRVRNQDGQIPSQAASRVKVERWEGTSFKGSYSANSSGEVTFSGLPYGTMHRFDAYYEGANPFDTYGELWVQATHTVESGNQVITLTRELPYVESLDFYANGQLVTPDTQILAGTEIEWRATVRNRSASSHNVRVTVRVDRSRSPDWDYEHTTSYQSVSGNNTRQFSGTFTLQHEGSYYAAIKTDSGTDLGKTDSWDWLIGLDLIGPVVHTVPYYDQNFTSWCVYHSLAMIARFYGSNITPWEIAAWAGKPQDKGDSGRSFSESLGDDDTLSPFGEYLNQLNGFGYEHRNYRRGGAGEYWSGEYWHDFKAYLINTLPQSPVVFAYMPKKYEIWRDEGHAVVLTGISSDGVYVSDPSGSMHLTIESIDETYSQRKQGRNIQGFVSWGDLKTLFDEQAYFKPIYLFRIDDTPMPLERTVSIQPYYYPDDDWAPTMVLRDPDMELDEVVSYFSFCGENHPEKGYGLSINPVEAYDHWHDKVPNSLSHTRNLGVFVHNNTDVVREISVYIQIKQNDVVIKNMAEEIIILEPFEYRKSVVANSTQQFLDIEPGLYQMSFAAVENGIYRDEFTLDFELFPVDIETVAAPTFDPESGAYPDNSINVTIDCQTEDAIVRYTIDGSEPNESSPVVMVPGTVSVPVPGTLKARAWKDGMTPSLTKTAHYTAMEVVSTPVFDPDGGSFAESSVAVAISCPTPDATIHYTTDGSDPDESSPIVTGDVTVPVPGTLKARAWKDGMIESEVKSAQYTPMGTVALPAFDPDGGSFHGESVVVTVTCATEGATIHYTIDGSEPTTGSPTVVSGGTVDVPLPGMLKARAWKEGMIESEVKSATYIKLSDPELYTLNTFAAHGEVGRSPDRMEYQAGEAVVLTAVADPGYAFSHWTVEPADAELGASFDAGEASTTLIMPGHDVTLTANYETVGSGVEVSNVTVAQRPGTRLVDITYDVTADTPTVTVSLEVLDGDTVVSATSLSGDIGEGVVPGTGKAIVWDAGADLPGHVAGGVIFTVTADDGVGEPGTPAGMVLIPGGTNEGTDPDFGAYSLTVESFYMDATPVTKAQWDEVYNWATHPDRGANVYSFDNAGSGKAANHPVHTVNWYDVVKWCNARSEKEGRTPVYSIPGQSVYRSGWPSTHTDVVQTISNNGYRLPTVTEHQYASRGGLVGRRFPWGDTINHSHANYWANGSAYTYDTSPYTTWTYHPTYATGSMPYTSPVGSFAANGYGLYDMAGNVYEWCWDPSGSSRGIRGGGWLDGAGYARCGSAFWSFPDYAYYYSRGFRAVCR